MCQVVAAWQQSDGRKISAISRQHFRNNMYEVQHFPRLRTFKRSNGIPRSMIHAYPPLDVILPGPPTTRLLHLPGLYHHACFFLEDCPANKYHANQMYARTARMRKVTPATEERIASATETSYCSRVRFPTSVWQGGCIRRMLPSVSARSFPRVKTAPPTKRHVIHPENQHMASPNPSA